MYLSNSFELLRILFERTSIVAGILLSLITLYDFFTGPVEYDLVAYRTNTGYRYRGSQFDGSTIVGKKHTFHCSRSFYVQVKDGDVIELQKGALFRRINTYQCERFMAEAESFLLRKAFGLWVPLLFFVSLTIHIIAWNKNSLLLLGTHFALLFINFAVMLLL